MITLLAFNFFIAIVVGLVFYFYSKEITFFEFCLSPVVALITSVVCYSVFSMIVCGDTQTISGTVISAIYQPKWVEEETTQKEGKTVVSHTTHYPKWTMLCNTGKNTEEVEIDSDEYNYLYRLFGKKISVSGSRSGFDYGDRNDYVLKNVNHYNQPCVLSKKYINRLKNSNSLFAYSKKKETISYPYPTDKFVSNRLLGIARQQFNQLDFDRMNSRLGPNKKVNVIIVGSNNNVGQQIEMQWQGGKKNDLIICYGKGWSYCFGWTDSNLVKRNLETLFLSTVNNTLLPKIEAEIQRNYTLKNWKSFNYVSINFPLWTYFLCFVLMVLSQVGYFMYTLKNEYSK